MIAPESSQGIYKTYKYATLARISGKNMNIKIDTPPTASEAQWKKRNY
jgi:hypothetical protein